MPVVSPTRAAPSTQILRFAMIVALAGGVAACGKKAPDGQTVASVNGEDITQSELNLEMQALGVNPQNKDKALPQVLQSMIDRKLIVQEAAKDGLDKSPEFVLAERRTHEILLAQRAVQAAAQGARTQPSESDVNAYLDKHPSIGAERKILVLDQVKFAAPRSAQEAKIFEPVRTMDQLVAVLQSRGAPFERSRSELDTSTVPDEAIAKLRGMAPGEPLVVIRGQVAVANVVVGERPAAGSSMQSAALAKQRLGNERIETALRQRQAALRKGADIQYADAFKPKTPPGAPAAPPK